MERVRGWYDGVWRAGDPAGGGLAEGPASLTANLLHSSALAERARRAPTKYYAMHGIIIHTHVCIYKYIYIVKHLKPVRFTER